MQRKDVIVIGAGQAGLAMSSRLSQMSIEHVLLERGGVANSWHTERWDLLRLLTPNWQSRCPAIPPLAMIRTASGRCRRPSIS